MATALLHDGPLAGVELDLPEQAHLSGFAFAAEPMNEGSVLVIDESSGPMPRAYKIARYKRVRRAYNGVVQEHWTFDGWQ
jgi:hypothetical protein